jgi:acetyl-CoA C-acetyltransferase
MADAYIYDAVRTPRGKGKSTGSLHEITALSLATQALRAIKDRNKLDTSKVDDVILGCVTPIGEQGSDIARIAVLNADYLRRRRCRSTASRLWPGSCNCGEGAVRRGRHGDRRRHRGCPARRPNGGAWSITPKSR